MFDNAPIKLGRGRIDKTNESIEMSVRLKKERNSSRAL